MRVVYLLLTYNQRAFVREAVRSALAQDYAPLDILVSDDASPDGTFDEIEAEVAAYSGPHTVTLNCNPLRLGPVDHLMSLVDRIGDAFVITAHGDDRSLPNRTRLLVEAWRREKTSMVSSGARWIGADGDYPTKRRRSRHISAERIVAKGWLPEMLGATLAYETSIVRAPQRLSSQRLAWGLDHILPWRAALAKGFYYLDEDLIEYRRHAANMGNYISDRSSSRAVFHETRCADEIVLRQFQLEDAVKMRRLQPFKRERWRLVKLLERRLVRDIALWGRARARLKRKGFGTIWLPDAEIRARRQTSQTTQR